MEKPTVSALLGSAARYVYLIACLHFSMEETDPLCARSCRAEDTRAYRAWRQ